MCDRGPRRPRPWRAGIVLSAVAALLVSQAGCGGEEASGKREAGTPVTEIDAYEDLDVTRADIERAGPGTPEGSIMRWWRNLQLGRVGPAKAAYAEGVRLSGLENQIEVFSPFLRHARPLVYKVETADGAARARTAIAYPAPDQRPPSIETVLETPVTFELRHDPGGWKLADNRYLEQLERLGGAVPLVRSRPGRRRG